MKRFGILKIKQSLGQKQVKLKKKVNHTAKTLQHIQQEHCPQRLLQSITSVKLQIETLVQRSYNGALRKNKHPALAIHYKFMNCLLPQGSSILFTPYVRRNWSKSCKHNQFSPRMPNNLIPQENGQLTLLNELQCTMHDYYTWVHKLQYAIYVNY